MNTRESMTNTRHIYHINTHKRELVDTNAYKLQPSSSERVVVERHDFHTALHLGVESKENQDKVSTLYWLPELRDTGLGPPVKYCYWPFQGGTSLVDHLCFSVLCLLYLCACLFIRALW